MLSLPTARPAWGAVQLTAFEPRDVAMVRDLSTDSYVPLTGSLVPHATVEQGLDWINRQHERLITGVGFFFCIAAVEDDRALGQVGLWLGAIEHGRATAGYGVAPEARGHGVAAQALLALTAFAWTLPPLHRVELYIEAWNVASVRTAEPAGYQGEGVLRRHQVIGGRRVDMTIYAALRPD